MFRYIIKKLYGGEISPWDRDIDKDSDRWHQSQLVSQKADALREILTPEQRKLLDEYVDEQHTLLPSIFVYIMPQILLAI